MDMNEMEDNKKITEEDLYIILKKRFNLHSFRDYQLEIIKSVVEKKDCFVIFPTGYGKSLIYMLAGIALGKISIVISPLIALMKDQVLYLRKQGIRAETFNSSLRSRQKRWIIEDLTSPKPRTEILFICPESILGKSFYPIFSLLVSQKKIGLISVDEAHCISQWGSDFRPKYRKLGFIRSRKFETQGSLEREHLEKLSKLFLSIPMLALTASATNEVKKEIIESLKIENTKIFQFSPNRKEIFYDLMYISEIDTKAESIFRWIFENYPNQYGLVYCQSRERTERICEFLQSNGIKCAFYHAKVDKEIKDEISKRWKEGGVYQVLVCTKAFGLGVDKADIRFVIHETIPSTLEEMYQESGRCGRDRQKSHSLVLYTPSDKKYLEYLIKRDSNDNHLNEEGKGKKLETLKFSMLYAETYECRRKMILQYFGEDYQPQFPSPNCCDYCRDQKKVKYNLDRHFDASWKLDEKNFWEMKKRYDIIPKGRARKKKEENFRSLGRNFEDKKGDWISSKKTNFQRFQGNNILKNLSIEKYNVEEELEKKKEVGNNQYIPPPPIMEIMNFSLDSDDDEEQEQEHLEKDRDEDEDDDFESIMASPLPSEKRKRKRKKINSEEEEEEEQPGVFNFNLQLKKKLDFKKKKKKEKGQKKRERTKVRNKKEDEEMRIRLGLSAPKKKKKNKLKKRTGKKRKRKQKSLDDMFKKKSVKKRKKEKKNNNFNVKRKEL